MKPGIPTLANLAQELAVLSQQRATGELILSSGDNQWHLYLFLGGLLYATGGTHRVRRWHRAVTNYCPGFQFDAYQVSEHEPWECYLLNQGFHQNHLTLLQVKSHIGQIVHEVFFDLLGYSDLSSRWVPRKQYPIALLIAVLEVEQSFQTAQQLWQQWQNMGLGQLDPDLAPVFKQPLSVQNLEVDELSRSLKQVVNGENTIWDIALQVKQPVTTVASAVQHLANQGVLELQTVPDFPTPVAVPGAPPHVTQHSKSEIDRIEEKILAISSASSIKPTMTTRKEVTTNELALQIQAANSEQFTGRLDIKHTQAQHWSLYFRQGDLIGCASSVHPIRRWCRQLYMHCPKLGIDAVDLGLKQPPCWDYDSLAELERQGKILPSQMTAVIEGLIAEILFDIHQHSERQRSRFENVETFHETSLLTYKRIPEDTIELTDSTLVSIRADMAWQQAMLAWQAWQRAGLVDYSPNLAPVIRQAEELRRQTSPAAYQNLTALADGNWTFRDLAVKLKHNLLLITQSIIPYIHQGLIGLIEVEDVSFSAQTVPAPHLTPTSVATPKSSVPAQPTGPLVAYIDDSRIDSLSMSEILSLAGYRFLNIQDPVKALPMLLEQKPDLIFLDLVMPVANGYEICAQIRRVSVFKDTPVIILTSNDGIVDRVRAKMVGSSGFLAKPINEEKVLKILQRHLLPATRVQSEKMQTVRDASSAQQV